MAAAREVLTGLGYREVEPLGTGSFSEVLRVKSSMGTAYAAKVSLKKRAREIAVHEATMMVQVPPHDNISRIYHLNELANATVLVMQFAEGKDTLKMMQERNLQPLSESDARGLFLQLIAALAHCHAAGVVHRDVKCENLLLTGKNRRTLLLTDFGFATQWTPGHFIEEWVGSLHYSAPEICARMPYQGPEVDVWSAGIVLYAWVTGRLPFGGDSNEALRLRIIGTEYPPCIHCSLDLTDLLRHMLTKNPAHRITIPDILHHPWVMHASKRPRPHPPSTPSPHHTHRPPSATNAATASPPSTRDGLLDSPQPSLPEEQATVGGGAARVRTALHLMGDVSGQRVASVQSAERYLHKHPRNIGTGLDREWHGSAAERHKRDSGANKKS